MRLFSTVLVASGLAGLLPAVAPAAPLLAGPPRRFYTARHQPYRRPPLRLAFSANTTFYSGDVTGKFSDNSFRLGLGLGLVRPLSPHLTFGLDVAYVQLKATDQFPERAYRFESTNGLLTTFLRYNILADKSMFIGPGHYEPTTVQPFLQAGLGATLFNPTATQRTAEGPVTLPAEERGAYPGLAGVLPVGGGVTLRAGRYVYFTLEGLYYFTTTDLLDNVSRLGNPESLDRFATGAFKLEYALHKKRGKPLVKID